MKPSPLMLNATSRRSRFAVMADVDDLVLACGGWIEGHTLMSNLVINFRFVLPGSGWRQLAGRIAAHAITLDGPSKAGLEQLSASAMDGDSERAGSLAISFIHDEPDLKREVPAIPG